jgi:hypothetical protein
VYKSRNLNINAFIELTSNVSIRFGGKENRENTHTSKGILIVIIDQNFFMKILLLKKFIIFGLIKNDKNNDKLSFYYLQQLNQQ